jgi:hypothetical protein
VGADPVLFAFRLLALCPIAIVAGLCARALIVAILERRTHRRLEREAWARHVAEINRERLGITPCDDIPAAWLRKRGRHG